MAKAAALDAKVAKLMEVVKKQRKEVAGCKKPQWLTSCSLELPGFQRITIQVELDLAKIAVAIGVLQRMLEDVHRVAAKLEAKIEPVWQGYSILDWITDLELRINITQMQAKQAKLAKLEAQLNGLLSEDQRRELALADIEAQLE